MLFASSPSCNALGAPAPVWQVINPMLFYLRLRRLPGVREDTSRPTLFALKLVANTIVAMMIFQRRLSLLREEVVVLVLLVHLLGHHDIARASLESIPMITRKRSR